MYRILIVDDDREITELLKLYLADDSIHVTTAGDGTEASELLRAEAFHLVLVDLMMPGLNGFELIKRIRERHKMPIIIISAKVTSSDKIFGLELGADDYVTKPFDPMEVVARVKAQLRRTYAYGETATLPDTLSVGDLTLDVHRLTVDVADETHELTKAEFDILLAFMEQLGRVFTKEQLYNRAWEDGETDDNALQVAISKLRGKIGYARIKTIRNLGYKLVQDER